MRAIYFPSKTQQHVFSENLLIFKFLKSNIFFYIQYIFAVRPPSIPDTVNPSEAICKHFMGVCKSRNPTRNPPGTLPGTPGTLPGTPGTPPGTRWNTSYEATHVFLYKFTCFALNSGCWMVTIFTFTCIFVF